MRLDTPSMSISSSGSLRLPELPSSTREWKLGLPAVSGTRENTFNRPVSPRGKVGDVYLVVAVDIRRSDVEIAKASSLAISCWLLPLRHNKLRLWPRGSQFLSSTKLHDLPSVWKGRQASNLQG